MIFKAAVEFKNIAMFKYLYDNLPHLFRIEDISEGSKIILMSKDTMLCKHLLNSSTTH
jgi:hypothetical protein